MKPPVIIGFFNNSVNTNKVEIAPLIGEILDILKSDVHEDDELLRWVSAILRICCATNVFVNPPILFTTLSIFYDRWAIKLLNINN